MPQLAALAAQNGDRLMQIAPSAIIDRKRADVVGIPLGTIRRRWQFSMR